ncbi:MAG: DUF2842 domain-containing protein [Rhodobacterales bacterium]
MALSYKSRRRWSLVLLLVWLPAYIVVAVSILNAIPRLPFLAEMLVYTVLGLGWALPFKFIFKGVGKEDPDA